MVDLYQPNTRAFKLGYAQAVTRTLEQNPYLVGTIYYKLWIRGRMEALIAIAKLKKRGDL